MYTVIIIALGNTYRASVIAQYYYRMGIILYPQVIPHSYFRDIKLMHGTRLRSVSVESVLNHKYKSRTSVTVSISRNIESVIIPACSFGKLRLDLHELIICFGITHTGLCCVLIAVSGSKRIEQAVSDRLSACSKHLASGYPLNRIYLYYSVFKPCAVLIYRIRTGTVINHCAAKHISGIIKVITLRKSVIITVYPCPAAPRV